MNIIARGALLAILIPAVVMVASCGAQTSGDQPASGSEGPATTASGKTTSGKSAVNAGAGSTRNQDDEREPGTRKTSANDGRAKARKDRSKGQPRRVALSLDGEPGTAFSGVCFVGGERTDFAAKTPQRYVFGADRPGVECRIVKKGARGSTLRAVLMARGERHAQRTNVERSVIALSLSKRGFSSEVRSSSGMTGGKSSSSVRMSSDQDSSIVTRRVEGEKDVAR